MNQEFEFVVQIISIKKIRKQRKLKNVCHLVLDVLLLTILLFS